MRRLGRAFLTFFLILMLSFCVWLGVVCSHYTVPILMYHHVDNKELLKSKLGVSPEAFERQMRFLRENKYNVIGVKELVALLRDKKRIPYKTVAVTFDDGYLNNYIYAFPILKKYNIPATIFVVVDRVGKRLGSDDYMNIGQIKELLDSGLITIGSHALTHPNLAEVGSEDKLKEETYGSKVVLEDMLKTKIDIFSYPYGSLNTKVEDFVRQAGYLGAVGTNFPRHTKNVDIYALKRLRISENCKNMFIFWVETSGFYTYIKEQRDGH